ncbi:hypothetical protein [Lyngbya aestuarii]|uniref:hypothetical protein n=1 Tax=Lyngbya aestuarii TaxID=118322 RepID=UPI00403E05F9
MSTFEQVLDQISELPIDQQELLIEIVKRRTVEQRRKVLARESHEALAEFKAGQFQSLTATEAIAELRSYVNSPEL